MPRKRSGSKTKKRTGSKTVKRKRSGSKKLYYGIEHKPKGRVYAKSNQALAHKQVRRYGEYEVPHRQMASYLKAHHLPPANYKTRRGGSKTSRPKKSGSKRRPSAYNKFIAEKTRGGHMTLTEAAREWKNT